MSHLLNQENVNKNRSCQINNRFIEKLHETLTDK